MNLKSKGDNLSGQGATFINTPSCRGELGQIKGVFFAKKGDLRAIQIARRDFDIFIGIDPGVNTGFAAWDKPHKRLLFIKTMTIHKAIKLVDSLYNCWLIPEIGGRYENDRILIRVEDARLRKWIPPKPNEKGERGRNQGAGSIKRDCSIWEDFLTDLGVACEFVAPAAGRTKWKAPYFKSLTKWPGKTDEHARDAAALVYAL